MKINLQNNQQGSILLYSLMVISLITAISIIVSIIVVNQIKLTSGAANGTQAYYAAEAGIEKGLFAVRAMRDDPDFYLEEDSAPNFSAIDIIKGYTDSSFVNKASFDISQAAATTPKIENQEIKENEYVQIDYYDVDDPLRVDINTPEVVSITVQNSGDNPASWAEVSWTAWDNQGLLGTSTSARKVIGPSDLSRVNGWPINNLDVFDPDPLPLGTGFNGDPVGYRVRIKALKAIPTDTEPGDLSSITVTPYDDANMEVTELASQVVIKSIGERNGFKQSLIASVPWKLPLFGLYDYVIFSESDIYKDIILNSPTYSSGTQELGVGLKSVDGVDQCTFGVARPSCAACQGFGWEGVCIDAIPNVACWAEGGDVGAPWDGTCKIRPQDYNGGDQYGTWYNYYGFVVPVDDAIPAGEEYFVSLRLGYACANSVGGTSTDVFTECSGRNIEVEVNGQSVVIYDLATDQTPPGNYSDPKWVTCTIPDAFSLGDPSLPVDDPSRTIQINNHPLGLIGYDPNITPYSGSGWKEGAQDYVLVDWYQVSTYKMFDDCY